MTNSEELTLSVKGSVVEMAVTGDVDEPVTGEFKLNALDQRVVKIFEDWLRKGKITEEEEMEVLGNILYNAIFNGGVSTLLDKKLQELADKKRAKEVPKDARLRLILDFQGDAAKWGPLPWEFLYYPKENTPLATKASLVLLRRVSTGSKRETLAPPEEGALKVLMIVVQPEEFMEGIALEDASKYNASFEAIVQEVETLKTLGIDVIDPLRDPTPEILTEALKQGPHVVHYIGYGKYQEKDGQIALMNPDTNKPDWYSIATFAGCFDIEGVPPRLVFLQLCQGPQKDPLEYYFKANFTELAPAIIKKHIPAVVAMRYPVQPEVAHKFTQKFYETLAQGRSVATAVQEARSYSTIGKKTRDLGSPVLFMHSNDGLILPLLTARSERSSQSSTTSSRVSSGPVSASANKPAAESSSPEIAVDDLVDARFESGRAPKTRTAEAPKGIEELRSEISGQDLETAHTTGRVRPKPHPKSESSLR